MLCLIGQHSSASDLLCEFGSISWILDYGNVASQCFCSHLRKRINVANVCHKLLPNPLEIINQIHVALFKVWDPAVVMLLVDLLIFFRFDHVDLVYSTVFCSNQT
jgi:hypothetical protein